MTRSIKIEAISKSVGLFLFSVSALFAAAQNTKQASDVSLEILSVRVLSPAEAARRSPDYFGPNVAVRMRLSSKKSIHYYALSSSFVPFGYQVAISNGKTRWFGYNKWQTKSPGFKKLAEKIGATENGHWLRLYARTAVEWEELASTHDYGETHAFTIFIKDKEHSTPREIISAQFLVPKEKPPPG